MGRILGYCSIGAHLALGLFCLGLGLVGLLSGGEMDIDLLPVAPENTAAVLTASGLFALLAVFLALGKSSLARSLLVLWSLAVAAVVIAAFFRGDYRFDGAAALPAYAACLGASLLTLLGSRLHWRRRARRGGRRR